MSRGNLKHGAAFVGGITAEYKTWAGIKRRCFNKNDQAYPRYGGRGIVVCERWHNDFAAFLEDMGPKPTPAHTIDRLDNSKGYEPGNCRWATMKEQQNNRTDNTLVEIEGFVATVHEWADVMEVDANNIYNRISKGMAPIDAITKPFRYAPKRGEKRLFCNNGHPWNDETAYVRPDTGTRMCITCVRANTRRNASRAIELQRRRRALNKARGEAVGIQRSKA